MNHDLEYARRILEAPNMSNARELGLVITQEVIDTCAKVSQEIAARSPKRVPSLQDLDQMEDEFNELHRRKTEADERAATIAARIAELDKSLTATKEAHAKLSKLVGTGTVPGLRGRLAELATRIESLGADIVAWRPRHAGMLKLVEKRVRCEDA